MCKMPCNKNKATRRVCVFSYIFEVKNSSKYHLWPFVVRPFGHFSSGFFTDCAATADVFLSFLMDPGLLWAGTTEHKAPQGPGGWQNEAWGWL